MDPQFTETAMCSLEQSPQTGRSVIAVLQSEAIEDGLGEVSLSFNNIKP